MLNINLINKTIKGNAKAKDVKKKGLLLASVDEMEDLLNDEKN